MAYGETNGHVDRCGRAALREPGGGCGLLTAFHFQVRQAGRRLELHAWPKFRCHGNKGRPHNILHSSIESAIPENPLVGPNISGLSAIQADL